MRHSKYSLKLTTIRVSNSGLLFSIGEIIMNYPAVTGRKLNVHKTFRRRPGRLLNVFCTFNLRHVVEWGRTICIKFCNGE